MGNRTAGGWNGWACIWVAGCISQEVSGIVAFVLFVRLLILDLHGARRYLRFGWNTRMDDTAAQKSYSKAKSTDRTLLVASSSPIAIAAA
jgi:hypothetical protein